MERTYEGVVVRWNERGFGFLFNDEINRRIFFHVSNWNHATEPVVGDAVTFQMAPGRTPEAPYQAVNVSPTGLNAFNGAVASKAGA